MAGINDNGGSVNTAHSVEFKKIEPDAIIPTRATPDSAGFDLYALKDTIVETGGGLGFMTTGRYQDCGSVIVPTGIAVKLPPGTYGRIAMRSGLAVKAHLAVSAGVIDRDYRGPIGVVTFMTRPGRFTIKAGERFAQLIIEQCSYAYATEVTEFSADNMQAHGGFGSTGSGASSII